MYNGEPYIEMRDGNKTYSNVNQRHMYDYDSPSGDSQDSYKKVVNLGDYNKKLGGNDSLESNFNPMHGDDDDARSSVTMKRKSPSPTSLSSGRLSDRASDYQTVHQEDRSFDRDDYKSQRGCRQDDDDDYRTVLTRGTEDDYKTVRTRGTADDYKSVYSRGTADDYKSEYSRRTGDDYKSVYSRGTADDYKSEYSRRTGDDYKSVYSRGTADDYKSVYSRGTADDSRTVRSGYDDDYKSVHSRRGQRTHFDDSKTDYMTVIDDARSMRSHGSQRSQGSHRSYGSERSRGSSRSRRSRRDDDNATEYMTVRDDYESEYPDGGDFQTVYDDDYSSHYAVTKPKKYYH